MMAESHEELTLPIQNANFIWYCSWTSILSAIVAYSRPTTARLAFIPASVFTTSIRSKKPYKSLYIRTLTMNISFSKLHSC